MSIAAAEARVAAQEILVRTLAQAGMDTTEAERTLTMLRRMLGVERAEGSMWTSLVLGAKRNGRTAAGRIQSRPQPTGQVSS